MYESALRFIDELPDPVLCRIRFFSAPIVEQNVVAIEICPARRRTSHYYQHPKVFLEIVVLVDLVEECLKTLYS